MHYNSLVKALTLLQLIISVTGLPLRPERLMRRVQLLRRVPYSVVAVDGGAAATSTTSSPIESMTLTVSATRTIDKTTSLSPSLTDHATPTTVAASTRTVSESGPTTTIASTLTRDHTLTILPVTPSHTAVDCETTLTLASSTTANATPSIKPQTPETSTVTQTSTMTSLAYGIPPIPTTQSYGAGASYSASRSWNSTSTSSSGPVGTAWSTAQVLPSSWRRIP